MDKYKKILKLLNEGKTLQLFVEDIDREWGGEYDRIRVLSGNESSYIWIEANSAFRPSCFTVRGGGYRKPKTSAELVNTMRSYDSYQALRIKNIRVV
jgi:hypothetical protein